MSGYSYDGRGGVGGGAGVMEAYPMDDHEVSPMPGDDGAQYSYYHPQHNGPMDDSDSSSLTPRTAGGGGSVAPPRRRASDASNTSYAQYDHSTSGSGRGAYSRAVYDEAQSRSCSATGGILYQRGQRHQGGVHSSFTSSNTGGSGLTSSLRSSGISGGDNGMPNSMQHPNNVRRGVSLSGNLMVHVCIDEEEDVELDKEEIRRLARGEADSVSSGENELQTLNDASTIGTTRSTQSKLSRGKGNVYVDGNPANNAIMYNPNGKFADEDEEARARVKEFIFSPPFRRTLFLGICFVLLALGVLLTLENFMRVKTAQDWIEPHRDKYLAYNQGGTDWTFGSDAPKPIVGAAVDYALEAHVADWARGTVRVPTAAGLDGYGAVALSETVAFKDVPLFWGLPFAGGSILESVAGQCLKLVQASDGKGMEGGVGNELHLSTSFVMGRKYVNVDLSNPEGIERASALALGSSGIADVVHSPMLHEASELFSTMNQGRLFVMVRHPVEREFARYRYLRRWDHGKLLEEADRDMSYAEYAHSKYVASNWMTRMLVRKDEADILTKKDMQSAKEILRRKALVGLYSDIMGAVRHYARYFGWDNAMIGGKLNKGTLSCFENAILEGMRKDAKGADELLGEEAEEGSVAWREIMERNRFDYELYLYSQQLYKFQIAMS